MRKSKEGETNWPRALWRNKWQIGCSYC